MIKLKINVSSLLNPKSKGFWVVILGALLVVGILLLATIFTANGFSLFQSNDFKITVDSPQNNRVVHEHTHFEVSGRIFGGPAERVYLWDQNYNVGVICSVYAGRYSTVLYSDDMSNGVHTLCVQAVGHGKLSNVAKVTVKISRPTYTVLNTRYMVDSLPQPFGFILRPVEQAAREVVVKVSGGTSSDDLNGDNIPDVFQTSPVSPTYNPTNIPLTFTLVIIGLFVVIVIVTFSIKEMITKKIEKDEEYKKFLARNPKAQRFELERLKTSLELAKSEKQDRTVKLLEKRIRELEKKMKKPVNIYLGSNQKIKGVK